MWIERRSAITGVVIGAAYGLLLRVAMGSPQPNDTLGALFGVMTLAFLFLVPFILGMLTVNGATRVAEPRQLPSIGTAIVLPWMSAILCLAAMIVMKLEGAICTIVALPVFICLSTVGGVVEYARLKSRMQRTASANVTLVLLPLLLAPVEHRVPTTDQLRVVTTSIVIHATPEEIWPHIADVPRITAAERPRRLSAIIGIPDPVEAVLHQKRVGGVREAKFAKGIRFDEIITDYRPPQSLAFDIRANTKEIPPTTLDDHVLVGGQYFDVLHGGFELQRVGPHDTLLVLRSTHRLSTHFNAYAGLWSDWIMRDVQSSLLKVIAHRVNLRVRQR